MKDTMGKPCQSMFCTSSPMPVKMTSILKKKNFPEVRQAREGKNYQAELPALLSEKVSPAVSPDHQEEFI